MHRTMDRFARLFALVAGAVLLALIILICLSIIGRSINAGLHNEMVQSIMPGVANALLATGVGPINGDFELVEAGMAFTIFGFLPLCQLNGAHASVDIFTARLPVRANRVLAAIIEVVFAVTLTLIAWQLFMGVLSKMNSGQTTLLLQFPVWWGYAISLTGAVAAAVVALYVMAMRIAEVVTGESYLPAELGADH